MVKTAMLEGPQKYIARHTGLVWMRDKVLHSDDIFSNRLADKLFVHGADRAGCDPDLGEWLKAMGMIKFFWKYHRDLDMETEYVNGGGVG